MQGLWKIGSKMLLRLGLHWFCFVLYVQKLKCYQINLIERIWKENIWFQKLKGLFTHCHFLQLDCSFYLAVAKLKEVTFFCSM